MQFTAEISPHELGEVARQLLHFQSPVTPDPAGVAAQYRVQATIQPRSIEPSALPAALPPVTNTIAPALRSNIAPASRSEIVVSPPAAIVPATPPTPPASLIARRREWEQQQSRLSPPPPPTVLTTRRIQDTTPASRFDRFCAHPIVMTFCVLLIIAGSLKLAIDWLPLLTHFNTAPPTRTTPKPSASAAPKPTAPKPAVPAGATPLPMPAIPIP